MPYLRRTPPSINTLGELIAYVQEELRYVSMAFEEVTELELRGSGREPDKPRDGMIVYTDGTSWDPGGGAGVYARVAGVWVKL